MRLNTSDEFLQYLEIILLKVSWEQQDWLTGLCHFTSPGFGCVREKIICTRR